MHGRLKVRTTEEQKERTRKQQELKVKAYRAAMAKIQAKRAKHELDDEMLSLSSVLLLRNPDIATLWNIRRECVEAKLRNDSGDGGSVLEAVCAVELTLTEQCLMVNPKSYGGWHHRCWTLEQNPNADWKREVLLCNKYLKLDERNFHTWDYRRYVVGKAGVTKEAELDYCTEKIKVNFSNYSSWHYRSLLLPELYPYEGNARPKRPMSEAKLQEELDNVLTAAFTDPNDSSAWFYQRWLLGYSRLELDVCVFRCDGSKAVLALTHAIPMVSGVKVALCGPHGTCQLEIVDWCSVKKTETDTTWLAVLPTGSEDALVFDGTVSYQLKIDIPTLLAKKVSLLLHTERFLYCFRPPQRSFAFSPRVFYELKSQLESCNSLLEIEPDSKWTLLTTALLMRAVDRQLYHDKSLEYLEKLQAVDVLREWYYKDLASRWILEKLLSDWTTSKEFPTKLDFASETQLTSICYAQYLSVADEVAFPPILQNSYSEQGTDLPDTFKTLKI